MRTEVAEVLIDIEAQLRQLALWEAVPPPASALASTEPFAVDTLTLPQVHWIMLVAAIVWFGATPFWMERKQGA